MVMNTPHQCVRQPKNNGGGCAEHLKKEFEIFLISRRIFLIPENFCLAVIDGLM